jgi:hypothetical protein
MARERWLCPHCGAEMPGPSLLCSGSFLDAYHPSNVMPVPVLEDVPTLEPQGEDGHGERA